MSWRKYNCLEARATDGLICQRLVAARYNRGTVNSRLSNVRFIRDTRVFLKQPEALRLFNLAHTNILGIYQTSFTVNYL